MRKIKAENIKNEEVVKLILDSLIPVNQYLDKIGEDSFEYENICEEVQEQFCEILEALNLYLMIYSNKNIAVTDLMIFKMWDYLREEIKFYELIKYLKKEYKRRDK